MSDDRRDYSELIGIIKHELEGTKEVFKVQHEHQQDSIKKIEEKLDKYNGIREKLDTVCTEFGKHKDGHWRWIGSISGSLAIVLAIYKVIDVVFK